MAEQRLIDANVVSKKLRNLPFGYAESFAGRAALKEIENAQTVEAAPVVHGRWETQGRDATCSVCKYIQIGAYRAMWYSPYCPSCGAKMDAKEVKADG